MAPADSPIGDRGLVDEASFMTGAELAIDGGLTSHVSHKGIADAIG